MEIHIDGRQASIEPPLLRWIAERLEDLTMLSEDISLARVTLVRHIYWRRYRTEAYIVLRLGGTILEEAHTAKTPYAAVYAAVESIEAKVRHSEHFQRQVY
jgi:ribosome-associated translation inhibitor RaiA